MMKMNLGSNTWCIFLVSLKISAINHGNFELGREQESKWHKNLEFLPFFTRELAQIHWYVSIQDTRVSAAIKQNDTILKLDVCVKQKWFVHNKCVYKKTHHHRHFACNPFCCNAWFIRIHLSSLFRICDSDCVHVCMCAWFQLWMFIWSLNLK